MKASRSIHHSSFIIHHSSLPRRGVVLLVVLALLALFALIAVAFVLLSGHAQQSALSIARIEQGAPMPAAQAKTLLQQAAMQVFRGPNTDPTSFIPNPGSVIGAHSLLEEIYGNNWVQGTARIIGPRCGGQLNEFTFAPVNGVMTPPAVRTGCVLTVVDPNFPALLGQSSMIVGGNPGNVNALQMLAFSSPTQPAAGNSIAVVINGAPFSGTGAGFNPASGKLDLAYDPTQTPPIVKTPANPPTTWPVALLPNVPLSAYYNSAATTPLTNPLSNPPGAANSDYTAADFQHMLLAVQQPIPNTTGMATPSPSLHRPELVSYWINQVAATPGTWAGLWQANPALCRMITLRPLGMGLTNPSGDHPNFTGSNPVVTPTHPWDPVTDPLDVDNDGDGIADSIWVDLGMPVRSTSDGRLYKPLFAILCVDLDGRLNLNAHGCLAQCSAAPGNPSSYPYYSQANASTDPPVLPANGGPLLFAGGATGAQQLPLPRGVGYGTAEINLLPLFAISTGGYNFGLYQNLLAGDATTGLVGRNGETAVAASPALPGLTGTESILFYDKHFEFQPYGGFNYANPAVATVFGSPPDPKEAMTVGLDLRGQPLWGMALGQWSGNAVNSPYELNLSPNVVRGLVGTAATDNPFSLAELERLLRPFDRDAPQLPTRLAMLTATTAGNPATSALLPLRNEITTESWDVPCPPAALSADVLLEDVSDAGIQANLLTLLPTQHVTDYLAALLVKKNSLHGGSMRTLADGRSFILGSGSLRDPISGTVATAPYFPLELLAGRKMDLNRPFGSGVSNGTTEIVPALDASRNPITTVPFDHLNNGNPAASLAAAQANSILARQAYARQLYLLAMLLIDDNYTFPVTGTENLSSDEKTFLTARRIAQWAINAACFRSNDSIMVPFEFDAKPFTVEYSAKTFSATPATDPWDVDGDLTTDETTVGVSRGVVWGCKRPELLLTETVAFHDRRVADTNFDDNNQKKRTDSDGKTPPGPADLTLDQTRIPQGSAFFELYCTRNRSDTSAPTDLYAYDSGQQKWYLDLGIPAGGRTNPQQSADGNVYPVWRMVITGSRVTSPQPTGYNNDVVTRLQQYPDSTSLEPEQFHTPNPTAFTSAASVAPGQFSLLADGPTTNPSNVAIDRIVWFMAAKPNSGTGGHLDNDRIFYGRTTGIELGGGEYCVVGPRPVTYVGAMNAAANGNQYGIPSPQKIVLNPAPVTWADTSVPAAAYPHATPDPSSQIKPAWGMVVAADPPTLPVAWTVAQHQTNGIGISISEPLPSSGNYYPEPKLQNPNTTDIDAYGDLKQSNPAQYFPNLPVERYRSPALAAGVASPTPGKPLVDDSNKHLDMLNTGTTQDYKAVFLQRLANPSAPFHPVTNPYRTVDWMPIDLTVFNGEDTVPSAALLSPVGLTQQTWDPDDPNPDFHIANQPMFQTRERGNLSNALLPLTNQTFNIWTQLSEPPKYTSKDASATNINFPFDLVNSLGYINTTYQSTSGTPWRTAASGATAEYYGDPMSPFPWLTFNYRPFVSQMELLLVPSSHPGRLLWEYNFASAVLANPYQAATAPGYQQQGAVGLLPYSHLLNFFESANGASARWSPRSCTGCWISCTCPRRLWGRRCWRIQQRPAGWRAESTAIGSIRRSTAFRPTASRGGST